MGSESTSKVEVRNSKSRKRTKKKSKSKGVAEKNDTKAETEQAEEFDEENTINRKHKTKRRKSDNQKDSNAENKGTKNKEEESNFNNTQNNENEEAVDNEATPPKRLKSSRIMAQNDSQATEDTEETDQSNSKVPKKPSIRQMKREKAEKKEMERREASRLEAMQKGLNYVSKWKHAKSEWKFEKLRQIWLMDNLLDQTSIPDDIFPTVLEYFEGCKGMAREQLLKKGMDIIRRVEEDEENRDEIMESVAYKRARQLLQALPTDT